jgi:hypothetical protein
MEYHGNLLSTEFKNKEFLKEFIILEKRKSLKNLWIHYLVVIPEEKLEEAIKKIQKNLLPEKYYAHLYNEDGSDIIMIFPERVFRLSLKDTQKWQELKKYMLKFGIPEDQTDIKPRTFSEEKQYYEEKPLVEEELK